MGRRHSFPSDATRSRSNLARDTADWIETLRVPEGPERGERVALRAWQREFLRGALAPDTRIAAVSMARGAGKSTTCAALAAAALVGPLAQSRSSVLVVAASFAQAVRTGGLARDFLAPLIERDRKAWRVQDSANRFELEYLPAGIQFRCLGTNPATLHGLAPALVICDEGAQWPVNQSERLWNALVTAAGKQGASRILAISTAPTRRDHWMSRLLREGGEGIWTRLYAAPSDDLTWANVKRANPGLKEAPALAAAIRQELAHARKDEASAHGFRAYRLNRGTSETGRESLIDRATFEGAEVDALDQRGDYVLGVDLGGASSWSAAAAYWPATGYLDAMAVCGSDPSLERRERADNVEAGLYERMARSGDLRPVAGKRVPDPLDLLAPALERWGRPAFLVADRYRQGELIDATRALGIEDVTLMTRGMGAVDGAQDVRDFRAAFLNGRVRPRRSVLLHSSVASAEVRLTVSGDAVLTKGEPGARKPQGRDDAACAAMLAVALGKRAADAEALGPPRYRVTTCEPMEFALT